MTVIPTPMIVYRHGDDVPGERIREILVYEDCISQPDRNVENPDNSDLLETRSRAWHIARPYFDQSIPGDVCSRRLFAQRPLRGIGQTISAGLGEKAVSARVYKTTSCRDYRCRQADSR
jgi:hypothetical protein